MAIGHPSSHSSADHPRSHPSDSEGSLPSTKKGRPFFLASQHQTNPTCFKIWRSTNCIANARKMNIKMIEIFKKRSMAQPGFSWRPTRSNRPSENIHRRQEKYLTLKKAQKNRRKLPVKYGQQTMCPNLVWKKTKNIKKKVYDFQRYSERLFSGIMKKHLCCSNPCPQEFLNVRTLLQAPAACTLCITLKDAEVQPCGAFGSFGHIAPLRKMKNAWKNTLCQSVTWKSRKSTVWFDGFPRYLSMITFRCPAG